MNSRDNNNRGFNNRANAPKTGRLHGWVNLDKPEGISSAQAVARVRRLLGAGKAGHGGTLDPLASGVLPIALGEATKTVSYAMDSHKAYAFSLAWGAETSTDDREGTVTRRSDQIPAEAEIRAILGQFTGMIEQTPPVYSAVKIAGQRAYQLARQSDTPQDLPQLAARTVEVKALQLLRTDKQEAEFKVRCGKGVYVRALARDLGRVLGSAAHIISLRRLQVGKFQIEDAISLDLLEKMGQSAAASHSVMPVLAVLDDIPALAVTQEEAQRLRFGQGLSATDALADEAGPAIAVLAGQPVALIQPKQGRWVPMRVFNIDN
jgi:tRNA pseudouridine55 synthase